MGFDPNYSPQGVAPQNPNDPPQQPPTGNPPPMPPVQDPQNPNPPQGFDPNLNPQFDSYIYQWLMSMMGEQGRGSQYSAGSGPVQQLKDPSKVDENQARIAAGEEPRHGHTNVFDPGSINLVDTRTPFMKGLEMLSTPMMAGMLLQPQQTFGSMFGQSQTPGLASFGENNPAYGAYQGATGSNMFGDILSRMFQPGTSDFDPVGIFGQPQGIGPGTVGGTGDPNQPNDPNFQPNQPNGTNPATGNPWVPWNPQNPGGVYDPNSPNPIASGQPDPNNPDAGPMPPGGTAPQYTDPNDPNLPSPYQQTEADIGRGVADSSHPDYAATLPYYNAFDQNLRAKQAGLAPVHSEEALQQAYANQFNPQALYGQFNPHDVGAMQIPEGLGGWLGNVGGQWMSQGHTNFQQLMDAIAPAGYVPPQGPTHNVIGQVPQSPNPYDPASSLADRMAIGPQPDLTEAQQMFPGLGGIGGYTANSYLNPGESMPAFFGQWLGQNPGSTYQDYLGVMGQDPNAFTSGHGMVNPTPEGTQQQLQSPAAQGFQLPPEWESMDQAARQAYLSTQFDNMGNFIDQKAMGGILDPNTPTLVGEQGPEMVVGNQVIPNQQLGQMSTPDPSGAFDTGFLGNGFGGGQTGALSNQPENPISQATGGLGMDNIFGNLLSQNPEQQTFNTGQDLLNQNLFQQNPGQGIMDALEPVFQRNLQFGLGEMANRAPSVSNSAMQLEGTDLTRQALQDFNLLGAQSLQQGVNQQLSGLQTLGGLANSAGNNPMNRALGVGNLALGGRGQDFQNQQSLLNMGQQQQQFNSMFGLQADQQQWNQNTGAALQLLMQLIPMLGPTAKQTVAIG